MRKLKSRKLTNSVKITQLANDRAETKTQVSVSIVNSLNLHDSQITLTNKKRMPVFYISFSQCCAVELKQPSK